MKLFAFTFLSLFSVQLFAATGSGEAQAELTNPLSITNTQNVDFGTIAIDPTGAQNVYIDTSPVAIVNCPATYVCSGIPTRGLVLISGAPNTPINADITGQTAILSDGAGHSLVFDPILFNGSDALSGWTLPAGGQWTMPVGGKLSFTGNEVAGTYSSSNAGGSGYQVTVNY